MRITASVLVLWGRSATPAIFMLSVGSSMASSCWMAVAMVLVIWFIVSPVRFCPDVAGRGVAVKARLRLFVDSPYRNFGIYIA